MILKPPDGGPTARAEKLGCLTYVFASFYVCMFSFSIFTGYEIFRHNAMYSKKHSLKGSNYNFSSFRRGRRLDSVHNNMIWGSIRSVQYWEDTMDIAGEDDTGLPGSKSFEQYAQQALQEECYSGYRMEMQAGGFTIGIFTAPCDVL